MLAIAVACGLSLPAAAQAPPSAPDRGPDSVRATTQGFEIRDDSLVVADHPSIALRFVLKPETAPAAPRLIAATKSALARLSEWLGPLPGGSLEVVDVEWRSPYAGASYPGLVVTSARWFDLESDRSLERSVIAAVAREYWRAAPGSTPAQRWLAEGLALYTGVRAIHEELALPAGTRAMPTALAGRHFAATRYFGGFVPFTTRSILWSPSADDPRPRIRHFPEVELPADAPWRSWSAAPAGEAQRVALALHTLERYLGWPAMQQALEAFQARWRSGPAGTEDFAAIISEQRGRDVRWFFDEALRFGARFDYGIRAFGSEPGGFDLALEYQTRVSLRRYGDGVFAGTAEAKVGPYASARSLPVVTRFADGTVVEDWWDGRLPDLALTYRGRSRAISASVDPDAMLLLDDDRSNNTRAPEAGLTSTGARLAAHWLLWLQDVMLVTTALL